MLELGSETIGGAGWKEPQGCRSGRRTVALCPTVLHVGALCKLGDENIRRSQILRLRTCDSNTICLGLLNLLQVRVQHKTC